MAITYEITVGRSYDYQKIEIKAVSDTPLSPADANKFRQELAKLGDEALRELKLSHDITKRRDELAGLLNNLEVRHISTYPLIEDGSNKGLIDTSKLDKDQHIKLRDYKRLREEYANLLPYNYDSVDIGETCLQIKTPTEPKS